MLSINLKSNVIWLWHSQYALGTLRALRAPRGFGQGFLMWGIAIEIQTKEQTKANRKFIYKLRGHMDSGCAWFMTATKSYIRPYPLSL